LILESETRVDVQTLSCSRTCGYTFNRAVTSMNKPHPPLRLSHLRHRFKYFPTSAPFYCILATAADVLSVLWPRAFWLWAVLVRNSGGISFHSHKFIYRLKLKVNSNSVLSQHEIISNTILSQTERAYCL